jgi:hypothetical protein
MKISTFIATVIFLCSCQSKVSDKTVVVDPDNSPGQIAMTMDSILKARPMVLSIKAGDADVDEFIPIGYNEEGSIAYFIIEFRGGSHQVLFNIGPGFGSLTVNNNFEMDFQIDTILQLYRNLIYYNMQSAHIKVADKFQKLSLDSFQLKYKYKFEINKTMSKPGSQAGMDEKTLATVAMKFDEGNGYMNTLIDKRYEPSDEVYDMYISDCFVIPGKEHEYGFVVVVTEMAGFEGTPRKTIELFGLGSLKKVVSEGK